MGSPVGHVRTALALACLCLTAAVGCVSVPLSTMVRMSAFGTQDFARLDPDVVSIRVKLPDGYALDAARSSLAARLTSAAGVHHGRFRLEQVGVARALLARGLFAADTWGTVYTLALSAPSKDEFRKLQAFVDRGPPGDVLISVAPALSSSPEHASSMTVWIDLLLQQGQGYFPLLDAAEVPIDAINESAAGKRSGGDAARSRSGVFGG